MDAISTASQKMVFGLQKFLLGVVLVPQKLAATKLGQGFTVTETWQGERLLKLESLIGLGPEKIIAKLREEKQQSVGYDGAVGTVYTNPFVARVNKLENNPQTPDGIYYAFLKVVFPLLGKPNGSQNIQRLLKENGANFERAIKNGGQFQSTILAMPTKEWEFIETSINLFDQSYNLVYFMKSLKGFMGSVGKIGLHNNKRLHSLLEVMLKKTFRHLQLRLERLKALKIKTPIRGAWLSQLDEMLIQITNAGKLINTESQKFERDFALIADPEHIKEDFEKQKEDLLLAASGLCDASGLKIGLLSDLRNEIQNADLHSFTIVRSAEDMERTNRNLAMALDSAEAARIEAERAKRLEENLKAANETIQDLQKDKEELQISLTRLDTKIVSLEEKAAAVNTNVQDFILEQKKIADYLCKEIENGLKDAETIAPSEQKKRSDAKAAEATPAGDLVNTVVKIISIKNRLEEYLKLCRQLQSATNDFINKHNVATTALDSEIGSIKDTTEAIRTQIDKLGNTIQELQSKITSMQIQMEKERVEKEKLLHEKERQIAELREQQATQSRKSKEQMDSEVKRQVELRLQEQKVSASLPTHNTQAVDAMKSPSAVDNWIQKEISPTYPEKSDDSTQKIKYLDALEKWSKNAPDELVIEMGNYLVTESKKNHLLGKEKNWIVQMKLQSDQTKSMSKAIDILINKLAPENQDKIIYYAKRHKKDFDTQKLLKRQS